MLVVGDGPDAATRAVAEAHGARYVEHATPRGINVARNTGLEHAAGDLYVFVDDDVEVHAGWLDALLSAAGRCGEDVGCFGGPIHARIEDHAIRLCGREKPPITTLDLGHQDSDADVVWGANMALRRSAVERIGRFDERHRNGGDEEDWQQRLRAAGGRVRYVAAAALDHRRAGDDARLRALARAAYHRGRASRRWDAFRGSYPPLRRELRIVLGSALHTIRFACANGIVMTAHALGRAREAWAPQAPPATPGVDDFLSGSSGTSGGVRAVANAAADAILDVPALLQRARLRRRGRSGAVAVLSVVRDTTRFASSTARLGSPYALATSPVGGRGKFANLNALLPPALDDYDWLIVLDDDVTLPRRFLDAFLAAAQEGDFAIAQPAHRRRSHAAWPHTRRRLSLRGWRATNFVEIGPVTAFRSDTFAVLLPFPDLQMGWGLDAHWSAVARDRGWRMGIVDAAPVGHTQAPAGAGYSRDEAVAEARRFLSGRPYVTRDEVR